MTRALVRSSKYSPGNMTPEALEALFVGRQELLRDVLQRISASALRGEKHFLLLVGPRGMGKTHFLALVHHRLRERPEHAEVRARLKIAYLNEEEWGIASFLDFLIKVLRALAREDADAALTGAIEAIYETHERSPRAALEQARALLIRHVGDKTLLLLGENLEDLFEGLGEEGQRRWRAFIQEQPFWAALLTTPALFADVQVQESPFYGFFTIRNLERLDLELASELLRQKALFDGKDDLAAFLQTPTGRARVRAIHHLAGGNHRVYVTMSPFLTRESLDELVTPFMQMVDDLTPYYQERMKRLQSPQQRKIVEFLSEEVRPAIVKRIANRCLISQQTASKQLGELTRRGFVRRTRVGKESYYELAEPLMRICIEVKDNRTEHLRLFVELLRRWFASGELRLRFAELTKKDRHSVDCLHIERALAQCQDDKKEPFLEVLEEEVERLIPERTDYPGLEDAALRLLRERGEARDYLRYLILLYRRRDGNGLVRYATTALERFPDTIGARFRVYLSHGHFIRGEFEFSLNAIDQAIKLNPKPVHFWHHRSRILQELQRHRDVIDNAETIIKLDASNSDAYRAKARALLELGDLQAAEETIRKRLESTSAQADDWAELGLILLVQGRPAEVLDAAERALSLDPGNAAALCRKGSALYDLHRYEEAIESEDRLLALDPDHAHSYHVKAMAFLALRRFSDALASTEELVKREPNHQEAWFDLAYVLFELARYEEAEQVLENLRDIDPDRRSWLLGKFRVMAARTGFGQALRWLLARKKEPGKADWSASAVASAILDALSAEVKVRGPLTMARQMSDFEKLARELEMPGLVERVLLQLTRTLVTERTLGTPEWQAAASLLETTFADEPSLRLPLSMLSAAARYAATRDEAVLLELPLELRGLLQEQADAAPSAES